MTSDKAGPRTLGWGDLKSLCALDGPCITITLPPYFRGESALPFSVNLKSAARIAEQELVRREMAKKDREALLAPLRALARKDGKSAHNSASVIFDSPLLFLPLDLPGPSPLRTVVGDYFHVLPLLRQLCGQQQFSILELNQEHLRLLRFSGGVCEEASLPAELPGNVRAAGAFKAPDHMLRDGSAAGQAAGMRTAVVFGTGTEREKGHERLHEFFRILDRGLSNALRKQPLLLSGAEYEVAIYRQEATYPYLMKGQLDGDLHDLSLPDIARLASKFARIQAGSEAQRQLHLLEESSRAERTSFDPARILDAARDGRVEKLILAAPQDPPYEETAPQADSPREVLNAAAVLSIRYGAEIFILPDGEMARSSPAAALFRY